MSRPNPQDAAAYYHRYINYVQGNSLQQAMQNHLHEIKDFYNNLPQEKAAYAYAEGKWTVKELLQHVIDTERIFGYRALCISRKDTTPLPGFEENDYAATSNANSRTLQSLKEEFNAVRHSTDCMLASLNDDQLSSTGTASGNSITANAVAFIILGHLLHHKAILQERYL